jgi:hypothetical protein
MNKSARRTRLRVLPLLLLPVCRGDRCCAAPSSSSSAAALLLLFRSYLIGIAAQLASADHQRQLLGWWSGQFLSTSMTASVFAVVAKMDPRN